MQPNANITHEMIRGCGRHERFTGAPRPAEVGPAASWPAHSRMLPIHLRVRRLLKITRRLRKTYSAGRARPTRTADVTSTGGLHDCFHCRRPPPAPPCAPLSRDPILRGYLLLDIVSITMICYE
ncbi:hypothetical protein EVAR_81908_1 [Eumeta japonica]|uniref:Uncharacterized protein n=1 Tax=Eumeta variegata TaxID=151549 RepID=A0A4C1UXK0_EUMVA|nr:hypothetical protein EVAR_81908_1 [Eumeta japonica]